MKKMLIRLAIIMFLVISTVILVWLIEAQQNNSHGPLAAVHSVEDTKIAALRFPVR